MKCVKKKGKEKEEEKRNFGALLAADPPPSRSGRLLDRRASRVAVPHRQQALPYFIVVDFSR